MASRYANNDCHFDWQLQPSHTSKDGESLLSQIEIHLSDNPGVMTIQALLFKAFIYVSDYRKDRAVSLALKCLEMAGEEISKCQNKEGAIGYNIVYHSLLAKIHEDILRMKAKAKDHKRKLKQLTSERTKVSTAFIDSVRAFAVSRLGPVKLDESINYFQRAVDVCPRNKEWLFGLALVYGRKTKLVQGLSTGETERSRYERTLYEDILKIDPEHINATLFLAEVLLQEGKIEESRLKYEQVLEIAPDNMKVNTRAAKFFRRSKQWEKALKLIEKAEQLPHTKPDSMLHHVKALIYIAKYDTNDESLGGCVLPGETSRKPLLQMALSELDNAVQLSSSSIYFGLERARVYVKLEQFDDANTEFQRLLCVKSEKSWGIDVVRLFLEYGRFLEGTEMQDIVSAMGYIKQAIEEAVRGCTSHSEDGTMQFFDDVRTDIEDAILQYEDFYIRQISTDAKDYNASNSLGWLKQTLAGFQINLKDPTTAMECYQRVYRDTMEESNSLEKECLCESLKGLVECHVTDKHLDKAKEYLEELKLLDEDMANTVVEDALIARGITSQGGITTNIEQDTGEEWRTQAAADYATDDLPLQYKDLVFGKRLAVGVLQVTFKNGRYKEYEEAAAKYKKKPLGTEVSIMKALQHQNIVKFLDFVPGPPATAPGHPDPYYIVMEKGECSLYTYLESNKQLEMPLQNKWAQEAAAAIRYLHDNDIVHRDIKPQNCLIFPEQVLKVSDFGISCEGTGTRHTSNKRGSDMYTAPEVEEHRTYSKASDIWALGILLWHIYARSEKYGSSFPPTMKDDFPVIIKGLLPLCWNTNPHDRPSIDEITDEVLSCL